MTWEELAKYKHSEPAKVGRPNYKRIPVNIIKTDLAGMETINDIFFFVKAQNLRKIVWTKRHYISTNKQHFKGECWFVEKKTASVEITICHKLGYWRFQFRTPPVIYKDEEITGTEAFRAFCKELEKDGVDLKNMVITDGLEVKKTIQSPKIGVEHDVITGPARTYRNAHHIDFHSSHPAGMAKYYPELRPTIERIYKMKEEAEKGSYPRMLYKAILNSTWGYLQADFHGARWAHISRDGIKDTNDRLLLLADTLRKAGRRVLAYNTDGIWYQGDIYHGEGEGDKLGEWGNDHINCSIRFKSKGSYEFMEDGVYHPVVRGQTRLDQVKPREKWEWGDIFNKDADPWGFAFDYDKGVYIKNV